jgi:site-specific DNA-methyltransferase (adenine-specific)
MNPPMTDPITRTEIILGDSLEIMKDMADNSVDLILTDPPYNISKLNDQRDRSKLASPIMRRKKSLNYDFGGWDNMERAEFLKFTDEWLTECCRVLKDGGTIISFFNKEDISYLGWQAKPLGIRTRTIISWHKTNPVPSFRKVNYLSACEFIWIGSKGEKSWTFNFGQQKDTHNFFETPNSSSYGETSHPTEKPLSLISWLIQTHTNEGDMILDPFLGSGTTAKACKQLNRQYIGIEINPDYVKIAQDRLKQEVLL